MLSGIPDDTKRTGYLYRLSPDASVVLVCCQSGSGFISFAKAVPRVRDGKSPIHLRRDLDPKRCPVMRWRWRRTRPGLRRRDWSHGHSILLIINRIGDEHSRYSVFLPAE